MSWEMYDEPAAVFVPDVSDFVVIDRQDYEDLMQIVTTARMLCEAIERRFGGKV